MPKRESAPEKFTMSFGDHLEELRFRIILAIAAPLPLMIVMWFFADDLLRWICRPLISVLQAEHLPTRLQVLGPPEALLIQLKIAIISALIISAPWILWQAWKFIEPGLYKEERRFVYFLLPGSAILTAAGVALLYYVMLPLVLMVLVQFGSALNLEDALTTPSSENVAADTVTNDASGELADIRPVIIPRLDHPPNPLVAGMIWREEENDLFIAVPDSDSEDGKLRILSIPVHPNALISQEFRLADYVSFVLLLMLGMVIAFQTPLVVVLLGWLHLVSTDWLRKNRRYALFGGAIISMFITPADPWSMIAMLVPLYLLYELGILLLVIAPAKKVAEGSWFRRAKRRSSDSGPAQGEESSQTDHLPSDPDAGDEPPDDRTDDTGRKA